MPQYALARHVFVCVQGEHVVFLNVRKDRYFALDSAMTAGLGHVVPEWPVAPAEPVGNLQRRFDSTAQAIAHLPDNDALPSVVALLLEKGILVAEAELGKAAAPVTLEKLRGDLAAEDLDQAPRIGMTVFCRFVAASMRAALMLKYRSFESVIDHAVHRRACSAPPERVLDISRAQYLVSAFATLRPFFFTAKDACLFDALALGEFLAGYRIYPRWVFGVQARPFAAHCWLQLDGIVFNDTVEHVKQYAPIMVV